MEISIGRVIKNPPERVLERVKLLFKRQFCAFAHIQDFNAQHVSICVIVQNHAGFNLFSSLHFSIGKMNIERISQLIEFDSH